MIFRSPGFRVNLPFAFREARRNSPMMVAIRSPRSCRAIIFLSVLFAAPLAANSETLEDSARELARKTAAVLPARETVSCEIRNLSSLQPAEVARIEEAFKAELGAKGISLKSNGEPINVIVTLSANFANLVWTAEIRSGDASRAVLLLVEHSSENRAAAGAMPMAIRAEKFWEGPERILDAAEISGSAGKSWLVLLLRDGLRIQDQQTGAVSAVDIASNQSASRDPWGNLNSGQDGNTVAFFLSPRACTVNLDTRNLDGCLPADGSAAAPLASRFPVMFDVSPPGPPPPGKGTVIAMPSICGGTGEFLATGARDYTQTDSVQVFRTDSAVAVAISAELDFPGPVTALHAASGAPRAVVKNLSTGNYEAYRLSFSCGQ
jgi:hypothetical protein